MLFDLALIRAGVRAVNLHKLLRKPPDKVLINHTISLLSKPIESHLQIRDVHVAVFTVRRPSHRVCRPGGLANDVVGTYLSWTTCCATYLPFGITGYLHRFWQ